MTDNSNLGFAELLGAALAARRSAHAPYSGFKVGAALRAASGRTYVGCNVENVSFGLTICAERAAVVAAIAGDEREFEALVVVADVPQPVMPCGACRQVLAEFSERLAIRCANLTGEVVDVTLDELLPHRFDAGRCST